MQVPTAPGGSATPKSAGATASEPAKPVKHHKSQAFGSTAGLRWNKVKKWSRKGVLLEERSVGCHTRSQAAALATA